MNFPMAGVNPKGKKREGKVMMSIWINSVPSFFRVQKQ